MFPKRPTFHSLHGAGTMNSTNSPQTAIEEHTNSELSIEQVDPNKSVPRIQERCLSGNDSPI